MYIPKRVIRLFNKKDHSYCRLCLHITMADVKRIDSHGAIQGEAETTVIRKGFFYKFRAPDRFSSWGRDGKSYTVFTMDIQACCKYRARALGWEAWVDKYAYEDEI